jgi:hypothetical protein
LNLAGDEDEVFEGLIDFVLFNFFMADQNEVLRWAVSWLMKCFRRQLEAPVECSFLFALLAEDFLVM